MSPPRLGIEVFCENIGLFLREYRALLRNIKTCVFDCRVRAFFNRGLLWEYRAVFTRI